MMRTVYLRGEMGDRFGHSFRLNVGSLAEVARALGCQIDGFRAYLEKGFYKIVCGRRDEKGFFRVHEDQISFNLPAGDIYVVPTLQGAKKTGLGKIVAGVAIAAVAWWAAPAIAGSSLLAGMGLTSGNIMGLGLGIAAMGLSSLIMPKKAASKVDDQSYMLNGASNTVEQGGPVPLIYGRFMVGSTMISAGVDTSDLPIQTITSGTTSTQNPGYDNGTTGNSGGISYG